MDVRALRDVPLFSGVSDENLSLLIPLVNEERHAEGGVVFEEGEVSDRFFIIASGEVEIRKRTAPGGGQKLIAVLEGGAFFGEMAVFLDEPRSASAVAKTDVALLSMRRGDLLEMFSKNPEASFKAMGFLTSVLMDRLRNTTRELVTVYETGRLVASARSMEELSDLALDGLMASLGAADLGVLVLWNEFNAEYEIYASRGLDASPRTPLAEGDPVVAALTLKMEPFVSFDSEADTRLGPSFDAPYKGRSLVASPLVLQGRLLGFLLFASLGRAGAFSYDEMVLLSAVSGYVSVAVENMRYVQEEVSRARLTQGKSTIFPY